jgi:phage terminase small subunit|tara:strand:+ start:2038 stop:2820 length:783 start_codon:yes stop_codon:yes gene_type:complete
MEKGNNIMELNERQQLFCQHYAVKGNATQAAIAAGYADTSGAAKNQGYRLLNGKTQRSLTVLNQIKNIQQENRIDVVDFNIVDEYIYQYESCKKNGHSNSALKALEKIEKYKTNESEKIKFLKENNTLYEQQVIDLREENEDLRRIKGLDTKKGWLYIVSREGLIKIGKTINLKQRMQQYKAQSVGLSFNFLKAYVVDDYHSMEREMIKAFNLTGAAAKRESEWYTLEKENALHLFESTIKTIQKRNIQDNLGGLEWHHY